MHVNEITNWIAYAQRFLAHIDLNLPGATAATLSLLGNASWRTLAENSGEKAPSDATVSTIIALVRGRELAVEAIRSSLSRETGVRS